MRFAVVCVSILSTTHQRMTSLRFGFITASLLCGVFIFCTDGCRQLSFRGSTNGRVLIKHVIATFEDLDLSICYTKCYIEHRCASINHGTLPNGRQVCELSSSDHFKHPQDLVPKDRFVYEAAENDCTQNNCAENTTGLPDESSSACTQGLTGRHCNQDIDECNDASLNKCHADAYCNNTVGSYNCTCKPGFSGDGFLCQVFPQPFVDCQTLHVKFPNLTSGMYSLESGGNHDNASMTYCDMTSHGGGWTMCYTSHEKVDLQTQVTFDPRYPYGTNGYRANCNNLTFNEIIFIEGSTGEQAYFRRRGGQPITVKDSFDNGTNAERNGLWDGYGVAADDYFYQLLICAGNPQVNGFFVSGYNGQTCFKKCHYWCNDRSTEYYRSEGASGKFRGVAFKENGFRKLSQKLISVGIRVKAKTN